MVNMSGRLTKVEFTNLDKILYPGLKITKAQIIEYYIKIAPKMLKLIAERPIMLTRFPNGIDKEAFYEKDAPTGAPSWVTTFKRYSERGQRMINYVLCNDLDTLMWLANLAALEIHVPLSKADSFDTPDLVLFDIDPEPTVNFDKVVSIALLIKEKLDALGVTSYVKTSGLKGIHIIVPIVPGYTFQHTREFVHQIGKSLSKESHVVVSEFSRSKNPGTVSIDYLQNSHGRTVVAPYSLRATAQATVSTPLEWRDVREGLKTDQFNLFTVVRIDANPWEGLFENRQKLDVK
jgi:bifunctional non-homologous end joining protein LigD